MSHKPDLQAVKSANGDRKRLLQSIHRILDDHRSGSNDAHCMKMIRHVLRRGQPGRGHEIEAAVRGIE